MRGSTLSTILVVVGVLCIAIAIYYIIPGFPHLFTFSDPNKSHRRISSPFSPLVSSR